MYIMYNIYIICILHTYNICGYIKYIHMYYMYALALHPHPDSMKDS